MTHLLFQAKFSCLFLRVKCPRGSQRHYMTAPQPKDPFIRVFGLVRDCPGSPSVLLQALRPSLIGVRIVGCLSRFLRDHFTCCAIVSCFPHFPNVAGRPSRPTSPPTPQLLRNHPFLKQIGGHPTCLLPSYKSARTFFNPPFFLVENFFRCASPFLL